MSDNSESGHAFRSAKILATLGPSSESEEMIAALIDLGVDVFRFNFSHGSHEQHAERYARVRRIAAERGRIIGILMDLQGPKLRVGKFDHGKAALTDGEPFRLDMDPTPGDQRRVSLPHPEIFDVVGKGDDLLIDDGKVRLRVDKTGDGFADCTVVVGGTISDNKGVNVPGVVLPISALTAKDRRDLRFGLELGVDWVALSFVQRPEDMAEIRRLVAGKAAIMAKIEKPSAVEHLDGILQLADGIMIARGDLGVELPPEDVPGLQKRMIRASRQAGKPVVVATQMLESMIGSATPTRAEASDVATAVYDGADAVMLSGETAAGKYPLEAVGIMERIVRRVERDPLHRAYLIDAYRAQALDHAAADAITAAASKVAETMDAAAIVTYTTAGTTALRASRDRPDRPILALVARDVTARRLAQAWGVRCVICDDATDMDEMVEKACEAALEAGIAEEGSALVITAGMPFGTPGATNLLRLTYI
ncbi:MAG: pyruvate kinase [Geminicoccaceae bacterium]